MAASESSTMSPNFCSPDADITIRSKDGILFRVHSMNLKCGMGALVTGLDLRADPNDISQWDESSQTLELLFQYLYPGELEELDKQPFGVVLEFAEAAEKWVMRPAMKVANFCMRAQMEAHPLELFYYSTKHGYDDITSQVAASAIEHHPAEVFIYSVSNGYALLKERSKLAALDQHPLLVFVSALQLGYHDIVDEAAPYTTQYSIAIMKEALSSQELLLSWILYIEKCEQELLLFSDELGSEVNSHPDLVSDIDRNVVLRKICVARLVPQGARISFLRISSGHPFASAAPVDYWAEYRTRMAALPAFSTFM